MKVRREDLLKILDLVKPGLAKKAIVEEFTHFVFSGKDVLTYNDEIYISHPFKTNFTCSVPAEDFYKILSGTPDDELKLDLDGSNLKITSKTTKAVLSVTDSEQVLGLVNEISNNDMDWKPLPKDFLDAVELCMFSASKDASRSFLTCVYVNGNQVTSSDDARISIYSMSSSVDCSFLIPVFSVTKLVKYEISEFCLLDSWVCFKTPSGVKFCCRRVLDEYPDCVEFFEFDGHSIQLPNELKEVVDAVSIMAEGDFDIDKKIEVSVNKNGVKCRAEKKTGWMERFLSTKLNIKSNITFVINPIFFSQILEKSTTMVCGKDRALFLSGPFKHLVALYVED